MKGGEDHVCQSRSQGVSFSIFITGSEWSIWFHLKRPENVSFPLERYLAGLKKLLDVVITLREQILTLPYLFEVSKDVQTDKWFTCISMTGWISDMFLRDYSLYEELSFADFFPRRPLFWQNVIYFLF